MSPYDLGPPPAYDQAYHRVTAPSLDRTQLVDKLSELRLTQATGMAVGPSFLPVPRPNGLVRAGAPTNIPLVDLVELSRPARTYDSVSLGSDAASNPPLSPISEMVPDVCEMVGPSGTNTRSVSAAVSDESVAGDSGVFEAAASKKGSALNEMNLETAQVQIKLRWALVISNQNLCVEFSSDTFFM